MKTQIGFTLLDLLISLAMLGMTVGFGVPNLMQGYKNSKTKADFAVLHRALALARQNAVIQKQSVTICGINANATCSRSNFDSIAIFIDVNRNGIIEHDETQIFSTELRGSENLSLKASLSRSYFRYKKDGSSEVAGSFIYCDPTNATHSKRLTVSMSGRIYRATDRDNDGIVETTRRRPISC